jgi:MFS family permease
MYTGFELKLTCLEAVGSTMGLAVCNLLVDKLYVKLQARHGEKAYPEGRLPLPIVGAFAFPFIVALYGYAPGLHWPVWVLLLAVILMGAAIVAAIVPVLTYVTDAFELYSASAMTAVLVLRNLGGTFIPLASAPLIDKFGYGPGFLVFSAALLVLAPIPPLIMKFGPRWRQWSKYSKDQ